MKARRRTVPRPTLPAPGQVFHKTRLPSGVRVVTEENPGSRSIALGVWVATGSRSERADQGGSAHFIEHLLFKGTPTRTAAALAREIDSIGGHLDAFTSREYTCFFLNILTEHLERGMDILSDIFLNSTFPPLEVERERKVILEEIRMSEDNPEDTVYELLVQNLWPRSPLGRPILGDRETIGAVSREKLLAFRGDFYRPSNIVFAAVGGATHEGLLEMWERFFPLSPGRSRRVRTSPPRFTGGFYSRSRDLEQTHLVFGTRGICQTHEGRYCLHVLNTIFGGSMSSRLFQEIREKRGLAYSVYSSHSSYRDAGMMTVSVGTSPGMARRVVGLVEKQIARILSSPPSPREIERAKDHLKGNVILGLESNGNRMISLARQEIYFGRQFGIDETLRGIEAVKRSDVAEMARELFEGEDSAWAAVGPRESLEQVAGSLS